MDPTQPSPGTPAPTPPASECCPRRSFMLGGLLGGAAGLLGGASGVAAAKAPGWSWSPKPAPQPEPEPKQPLFQTLANQPDGAKLSYAQFGEDLVASSLFWPFGLTTPTYLDIGAYEPIKSNNTYLFYTRGARGVLVEPNVGLTDLLRKERPEDKLLVAGIGVTDVAEADYYVIGTAELNTFDKSQAERLEQQLGQKITKVVKMPLLNINRVIEENFGGKAPDYLSIDIEGFDFAVLQTLDFKRFRPKLICAETVITGTLEHNQNTPKLLVEKGYQLCGMTHPNMFFMDKEFMSRRK